MNKRMEKPKVRIYHTLSIPDVKVDPPDSVDVEFIDLADVDLIVVTHKDVSVYWCVKDMTESGDYTVSEHWMAVEPWCDIESVIAFDFRDLPKVPFRVMKQYRNEYPNDSELQIRVRYAIDTEHIDTQG